MRCVHMGLNTEPDYLKADEVKARWRARGNEEMVQRWEDAEKRSLELKAEIEQIMEEDGECRLSWSCDGRTRHQMHSCQWQNAMENEHPDWEWTIGYNYECTIRKR